jgi:hypothetical protein
VRVVVACDTGIKFVDIMVHFESTLTTAEAVTSASVKKEGVIVKDAVASE